MPRPNGQIRRSQMITTFGPGALVDLLHHAAIVGGLETWKWGGDDRKQKIEEPRLVGKIQAALNLEGLALYAPPADDPAPDAPPSGVTAFEFPEWFVAQMQLKGPEGKRSRPLVHRLALVGRNKYQGPDKIKYSVVPVRFVQACINGHISDLDWYAFVHGQGDPCRRDLFLDERGTGGDLSEIEVRCDCGKNKALILLLERGANALGKCRGQRPWLGEHKGEQCRDSKGAPAFNRLLIRSASNAYFPQILSVISIPDENEKLQAAVGKIWDDFLSYVEVESDLPRERKKARVHAALEGYSDEIVWREIDRRRTGGESPSNDVKKIKNAEVETLLSSAEQIGEDKLEGDFYARALPRPTPASALWGKIERVVLVHRLREVVAQIGFTRFEPAVNDTDGELNLGVRTAQLAEEVRWLPAFENRGEGVFIAFKKEAVAAWRNRAAKREVELYQGFQQWQARHPGNKAQFPGVTYIMLHSLAHLMITAVALECGYSSSAIRERIYASDLGYGILLYTGTPDSEGTLGGLVEVGRSIERHLRNAIELGRLCSNDPVCSQHTAKNTLEEPHLLGAACHGCLLISETSCERFNQHLDRSLVVATVGQLGAEFFLDSDLG